MDSDGNNTNFRLEIISLTDLNALDVNSLLAGNTGSDPFALEKPLEGPMMHAPCLAIFAMRAATLFGTRRRGRASHCLR